MLGQERSFGGLKEAMNRAQQSIRLGDVGYSSVSNITCADFKSSN